MILNSFDFGLSALNVALVSCESPEQLAKLQRQRFKSLITHAFNTCPFYRALYQNIDISKSKLSDIPIVNKQVLMSHFDSWVGDPEIRIRSLHRFIKNKSNISELYLGKYVVWESSGSSGKPGIFLQDLQAMAIYEALESIRIPIDEIIQHALNPFWLCERVAFVGAINGHFASNVSFERMKAVSPVSSNMFKSFSILDSVDTIADALNSFLPSYLVTYPTAALALAEKILKGSLKIHPLEIWTGGEVLTKSMRSIIEKAFGAKVRNSYGASEFLPIARECKFGNLHVNSDWVILEAVDDKYRPVPRGQFSCTTLLTNLANKVQPLIRYDIGDSIRFHATECQCGSSFPAIDVIGRKDGIIQILNDQGDLIKILPLALTTVMEEEAGIFDFQIVQKNASTLILRLPHQNNRAQRDMAHGELILKKYLRKQGASKVRLITESISHIIPSLSGKCNRIIAGKNSQN